MRRIRRPTGVSSPTPVFTSPPKRSACSTPNTPAQIEAALAAVRELAGSRRIVCVVAGAGGVDRRLRAARTRAALRAADVCILTTEDARDEHPGSIVMDMLEGARGAASDRYKSIVLRPTAIAEAIHRAAPDGIVVILGKRANGAEIRGADRRDATDALQQFRTSRHAESHPTA